MIPQLEKLLGTPRDGALLRYSLALEHVKAGRHEEAVGRLREALGFDPAYSAAWRQLGRSLAELGRTGEALEAFREGIEVARRRGDKQAEKEMTVFARRLDRQPPGQAGG